MSLIGESDSWSGEYTANISAHREDGKYVFSYKNETDEELKNIEITINEKLVRKESDYKGKIIEISTGCAGCAVTDDTLPIKVKMNWDDKEETFYLKS
ncbi:hypothetical protein DL346_17240 [Paenibacillus montanisoli]|uniref:Ig-like domain-containing protein n=1 Tax=Paenibacillus montanisoli TaxID=2081970 RepID=A0A328TYJ4_9BACL|nr:hypothetical protein DL346_17240 [Paenibacillus montanisoli]